MLGQTDAWTAPSEPSELDPLAAIGTASRRTPYPKSTHRAVRGRASGLALVGLDGGLIRLGGSIDSSPAWYSTVCASVLFGEVALRLLGWRIAT